jgi:serine/threonine protein phosphatase PrpC
VKNASSPQQAAIMLRDMAYQLGSQDNISVVVVSFPSSSKPTSSNL